MSRRKNGEGSIIELENGKATFRQPIGYLPNGNVKYKSKTFEDKETALKVSNHILLQKKRENLIDSSNILFSDYADKWLTIHKKSMIRSSTYDILENLLSTHIYPIISDLQLHSITSKDLQKLIDDEADVLALNTLKGLFSTLNSIFYYAYLSNDIEINPMDDVVIPFHKYPLSSESKITVLTQEEQILFFKTCFKRRKNGRLCFRHGPALALLLSTGMRSGELLSLQRKNINLESREINISGTIARIKNRDKSCDSDLSYIHEIHNTKSVAGKRVIPINLWAEQAIRILEDEIYIKNDNDLIFPTKTGSVYTYRVLATGFDRLLYLCNIEHRNLHCLRHSFATQMLYENEDIVSLSKILGHKSPITTYNIYIHFIDKDKEEALKLLE